MLNEGECLLAIVKGRVKEVATKTKGRFSFFDTSSDKGGSLLRNYLILTNERVILRARGVFASSTDAFEYSHIKSVEMQNGIMFGAIVLNVYGKTENFAEMDKKEAKLISDMIRNKIREVAIKPAVAVQTATDPVQQLEKLAALYKQGLLTEDEFQQQKQKLLNLL